MARRDKGTTRITDRDLAAVQILCQQGVMRQDDYGDLLAILGERYAISGAAARRIIKRQIDHGLIERRRIFFTEPAILAPTWQGARMAGWRGPTGFPVLSHLRHTLTCAAVANSYRRNGDDWEADRQLYRQPVAAGSVQLDEGRRRPDGVATTPEGRADFVDPEMVRFLVPAGTRTAIEVELHAKSRPRTAFAMRSLTAHYDRVTFWTGADDVATHLESVRDNELVAGLASRISVRLLGEMAR